AARAELDQGGRFGVFGIEKDAAMITAHHAAANFAGEIGILVGIRRVRCASVTGFSLISWIVNTEAGKLKSLPITGGHGRQHAIPKACSVDPVKRNEFTEGHFS